METKYYKIDEFAEVKSGKRIPKGMSFSDKETDFRYIRARNIKNGKIMIDDLMYIDEDVKKKINKYIIQKDDIAITIVGENIGDVGICTEETNLCNLTENACRLTNYNLNIIDPKYLVYYLNQPFMKEYMKLMGSGSAQGKLGNYKTKKIKIKLPDLYNQKQIVRKIIAIDNLIENNNKRIKILKQMAEELYKEWFVRFRFPGFCNEEWKDELPKGWQTEKLETVAMISTGKCNREDAVENGKFPLFDRSQEIKKSDVWLKDCEAIIVPGEGTSFIPRYYKGKFNLHQRCYCVEPRYENIGFFLFQTLKLNRIYFLSVATGATVPSLRMKNFTSMKFILPSIDLCTQYNKLASDFYEKIKQLNKINENLIKQRDLLLPRLMSGKLEVK